MKKVLVFSTLVFLLACNKDKFQTKPTIEIVNYNTKVLPRGSDLVIDLEFTDKEGDLSEGEFYYIRVRTNKRKATTEYVNPVKVTIPVFPERSKGVLSLKTKWDDLHKSDFENDSLFFRFVVVDQAGNASDTVNSDQIVVLRQ